MNTYNKKLLEIEEFIHVGYYEKAIDSFETILDTYSLDMLDAKFYYLKGKLFEENNQWEYAKNDYWMAFSKDCEDVDLRYSIAKSIERVSQHFQEQKRVYCLYGGIENDNHILQPLNTPNRMVIPKDFVCVKDKLRKNDFVDVYLCGDKEIPTSIEFIKRVNDDHHLDVNSFTAYEGEDSYIFISYSHKDEQEVLRIIDALQKAGFRVWFDRGIEVGTEWPQYIAEHVLKSSCVICMMSKNAALSQNCRNEINFSLKYSKNFITVYLEEFEMELGLQLQLDSKQAIFKNRSQDFDQFMFELSNAKLLQVCK